MSNREFFYMLECLKEVHERILVCENNLEDARSVVHAMEKRIEEYFIAGYTEEELHPEDERDTVPKEE